MSDTISAAEAAQRLGVSLASVYKLVHAGELPGYAVGRRKLIYAAGVEEYRKRHAFADPAPEPRKAPTPAPFKRPRLRPAAPPEGLTPFRHFH